MEFFGSCAGVIGRKSVHSSIMRGGVFEEVEADATYNSGTNFPVATYVKGVKQYFDSHLLCDGLRTGPLSPSIKVLERGVWLSGYHRESLYDVLDEVTGDRTQTGDSFHQFFRPEFKEFRDSVNRGIGLAGPVSADYGLETLVSNLTRALSQGRSTFMRLQASGVAGGAAFSREASSASSSSKRKGGRTSAGARPTTAAAVKEVKVKPAGQINLTRGPGTDRGVERKMGGVPGISLGICDSVWCTKSHWCNRSHEGTGREAGAGSGAGQGSGAGPVT